MVKHVVMWEVKGSSREEALRKADDLRRVLMALADSVPSLDRLEVAVQDDEVPRLLLYSEFRDWESLEIYRSHPDHQAVIPVLRQATVKVGFVDYQV